MCALHDHGVLTDPYVIADEDTAAGIDPALGTAVVDQMDIRGTQPNAEGKHTAIADHHMLPFS